MRGHDIATLALATFLTWSCRPGFDSPNSSTKASPPASTVPVPEVSRASPIPDAGMSQVSRSRVSEAGTPAGASSLGISHEHQHPVDHVARATSLEESGDADGAIAELRRAVFDDPENTDVLERLGRVSRHAHQNDVAIETYQRLSKANPSDALPEMRLSRLFLAQDQLGRARAAAEEALRRDPASAESEHLLGRVELSAGRLGKAIDAFEQATSLDPSHAWAYNNLGYACLLANENDKAADALEEAVALKPEVASIWNNLGVALERLGRHQDAMGAFARSLELNPRYTKAKINANAVAIDDALPTNDVVAGGADTAPKSQLDDEAEPQPIPEVEPGP